MGCAALLSARPIPLAAFHYLLGVEKNPLPNEGNYLIIVLDELYFL
jgi:hypothetical protein